MDNNKVKKFNVSSRGLNAIDLYLTFEVASNNKIGLLATSENHIKILRATDLQYINKVKLPIKERYAVSGIRFIDDHNAFISCFNHELYEINVLSLRITLLSTFRSPITCLALAPTCKEEDAEVDDCTDCEEDAGPKNRAAVAIASHDGTIYAINGTVITQFDSVGFINIGFLSESHLLVHRRQNIYTINVHNGQKIAKMTMPTKIGAASPFMRNMVVVGYGNLVEIYEFTEKKDLQLINHIYLADLVSVTAIEVSSDRFFVAADNGMVYIICFDDNKLEMLKSRNFHSKKLFLRVSSDSLYLYISTNGYIYKVKTEDLKTVGFGDHSDTCTSHYGDYVAISNDISCLLYKMDTGEHAQMIGRISVSTPTKTKIVYVDLLETNEILICKSHVDKETGSHLVVEKIVIANDSSLTKKLIRQIAYESLDIKHKEFADIDGKLFCFRTIEYIVSLPYSVKHSNGAMTKILPDSSFQIIYRDFLFNFREPQGICDKNGKLIANFPMYAFNPHSFLFSEDYLLSSTGQLRYIIDLRTFKVKTHRVDIIGTSLWCNHLLIGQIECEKISRFGNFLEV